MMREGFFHDLNKALQSFLFYDHAPILIKKIETILELTNFM